jgi:hypothetical protein
MPNAQAGTVLRYLRKFVVAEASQALTDRQLLQPFLAARDQAAFAAPVRRHAPLVWGVCRHVLRHEQDAEGALQATFLVLARRAAAVRKAEAARELGCKEGTVWSCLSQARKLLQERLTRRGAALSTVLCLSAASTDAVKAATLDATVKIALAYAAGNGPRPGRPPPPSPPS